MTDARKAFGVQGERVAEALLRERGYRILERNVRTKLGELDLVARDGDTLCFIEVKARRSAAFGMPQEAVTRQKQLHLTRAAQCYLKAKGLTGAPARFDVVALILGPDGRPTYSDIIRHAFEVAT